MKFKPLNILDEHLDADEPLDLSVRRAAEPDRDFQEAFDETERNLVAPIFETKVLPIKKRNVVVSSESFANPWSDFRAPGDEQRGASTSAGSDAGYAPPAPPRPPVDLLRPAEPSRLLEMLTSEGHCSPAAMARPGPPPPPHPHPHHPLQHPHPHAHPRVPGQPGTGSLPPSPADSGVSDVDSSSGNASTDELKPRLHSECRLLKQHVLVCSRFLYFPLSVLGRVNLLSLKLAQLERQKVNTVAVQPRGGTSVRRVHFTPPPPIRSVTNYGVPRRPGHRPAPLPRPWPSPLREPSGAADRCFRLSIWL
ncbi:hypothetical protein FJT64_001787 [Amphibalanus amphitrite]|uniref:Uncharacterized protein n=1 Tax=Amphibalanus amphitrite TaxID=1232801 RepID=A0A6A4X4M4_AMPAM|nr:hypothetical protein FJT64_001787 [Amphibalanus amphitrite]